jgi:integrase
VDLDQGRLTIHSPKTDRHAGHESRQVPLFHEILPFLREVFEQAEEGEQYVLPMLQGRTGQALRKPLIAAIKRAGLVQWPRLWHNLRSTRQTELEDHTPTHVVCAWLSNNESTARQHYLQVTDEHFAEALQNPVQQVRTHGRTGSQNPSGKCVETHINAQESNPMVPAGIEPTTVGLEGRCSIQLSYRTAVSIIPHQGANHNW